MSELVWTGICLQYMTLGFVAAKVHSRHRNRRGNRVVSADRRVTK